jgi:general secretion pathway protein A
LTGEVGTGKTMALRWIIRRLESGVLASYILNPHLSIEEFYHYLADMIGLKQWSNKSELLSQIGSLLEQRHQRGLRTVLIVDEAHELSDEVLEEIRLLLNFESDTAKHLQIILTGQPELTERLRQPNLRQLKQRVAFRCKMPILTSAQEVKRFINTRLKIAGWKGTDIFTQHAIDLIYQCSAGIPRQINNLCDNALLSAYSANKNCVDQSIVEEVADNLDMLPDRSTLLAMERKEMSPVSSSVLTPAGRDELIREENPDSADFESRDYKGLREA